MGRIVGGKKKRRPSNADLPDPQPRRSCRRRNVRYTFDIDDYVDDEEFYKDVGRREKKLRVLLGEYDSESNRCEESSSSDEYDEVKASKKRKIDAVDREFDGEDDEIGETRGGRLEEDAETGGANSVPGSPSDPPNGVFLPDKKTLELILDKLQKKDTYGVYAEPVDPDELPDYYAVIKQPMDFATVRKKLAKGTYVTSEQFESDVILICTNAMKYNAPDTIYYKQASSILELAKTKFQLLNLTVDHPIKPNSLPPKKQPKRSTVQIMQEPAGSDFSGEFQNDENRWKTFNMSIHPVIQSSESIFSTFEGESKQLIPVGLHSDNSYTRSLARFAATLGSVAWKIASRRIEEALPEDIKFGLGWVGEYEPLSTHVLMIGNGTLKEPDFLTKYLGVRTGDKGSRNTADDDEKPSRNSSRKQESPKGSSSEMASLNASDIRSPRPASVSYFKHPNRGDHGFVSRDWKPVSVVSNCNTIGSDVGPSNVEWMSLGGVIGPHVGENVNSHHRQHHVSPFRGEFQNQEAVFPRLVTADMSRFQVQSHWRAVSPQQPPPRFKQRESRPPDLNISYQSPGMVVNSQHPDLALQL